MTPGHPWRGLGASPGIAEGVLVVAGTTPPDNESQAFILLCNEGGKEDLRLLSKAVGVLALRAGLTGDIAIMARALGKPCVVSCAALSLRNGALWRTLASGSGDVEAERVSIKTLVRLDGGTGEVRFLERL
jgi:phosphoenolpyruvate synthase/pyruvate phosphate dikinase